MKKMFKRTTAIAASALMIGQMVPYSVFATPAELTYKNKLTIYPYTITDDTELNSTNASPTGTSADGDKAELNGSSVATGTMTFTVVRVKADGTTWTDENPYSNTSATNGTTLENLPDGYYKITPHKDDTDSHFEDAESFFIELPSSANGNINRNVYIYPKFTVNDDTDNNEKDPETVDPENPGHTTNTHAIKLKKQLSDSDSWTTDLTATFKIYYQDDLGKWKDAGNFDTNDQGVIQIDGLPLGTYWAVEQEAPEGYLLDKTPIKFELDGTGEISKQVKEFVNDKKLTAAKEIDGDGQGKTYNWTITTDIPSKADKLLTYIVTDTFTNTLSNVKVESVKVGDEAVAASKYTVTTDETTGKVIVTITDMTALTGGSQLTINVSSNIGTGYTSGEVTNNASLKYQYAYDPVDNDGIPDDIPGTVDPVPYDPDNPDAAVPTPIDTDTANDSFTPATIKISNIDRTSLEELDGGVYDITGFSVHKDSDDDGDGDDAIVTLTNLAPGHYKIDQYGTKSGYFIDKESPKYIYINKDGEVILTNNATDTTGTLLTDNTIVFKNDKTAPGFELPFTGTTAAIVFTIAGIGIMGGAMFFIFILFKKRDKDEEDKENA